MAVHRHQTFRWGDGMKIHGSAGDRGQADSYYGRASRPHKIVDDQKEFCSEGSADWDEYVEAYEINESAGNYKNWG
jgi:hypothetical protein